MPSLSEMRKRAAYASQQSADARAVRHKQTVLLQEAPKALELLQAFSSWPKHARPQGLRSAFTATELFLQRLELEGLVNVQA